MTRLRRQRIGVLGGTFNPVHLGHLLIAQDALEAARLDRVLFIPTATPPHKQSDQLASARERLQMLRLAVRDNPRFGVDDLEIRRGGPSYSVDTLTELRRRQPGTTFVFIIGSDSLAELEQWKEIGRLARLCSFITVIRPGVRLRPPPARLGVRNQVVTGHLCDIASTDLRQRIADGKSLRYLVPAPVVRYIQRQKLYQ